MNTYDSQRLTALLAVDALAFVTILAGKRTAMEAHERAIREEQERRRCA